MKNYTANCEDFKPLTCSPVEELFREESMSFELGIVEAAKRVLAKKHYCEDILRIILDVKMEEADE